MSWVFPARIRATSAWSKPWRKAIAVGVTGIGMSAFAMAALQGTQGQIAIDHVSPEDVSAARYFYNEAPPGSNLVLATSFFPTRLEGDYRRFNPNLRQEPALTDEERFRERVLDEDAVPEVTDYVRSFTGPRHYLAISDTMEDAAGYFGQLPSGSLDVLTDALRESPQWRVFYENDEVVIFEVT